MILFVLVDFIINEYLFSVLINRYVLMIKRI